MVGITYRDLDDGRRLFNADTMVMYDRKARRFYFLNTDGKGLCILERESMAAALDLFREAVAAKTTGQQINSRI